MENIEKFLSQILILDTETTGLDTSTAEIVELAGLQPNKDDMAWSTLYGTMAEIPPEVSEITHISNRMIKGKPRFEEKLNADFQSLLTSNQIFIAHNAKYDREVLTTAYKNAEVDESQIANVDNWICTLKLARFLIPGMKSYKLDYLRYALELDADQYSAHRASGDVMVTFELMKYLLAQAFTTGAINENSDIGLELVNLSQTPIPYTKWPFGKHKDVLITEIPIDYVVWALTNLDSLKEDHPNFNSDLAFTIQEELKRRNLI